MPKQIDYRTEHDIMVRSLARYLREQGHNDIKVNMFGYDTPDQIYFEASTLGQTPDITSTNIKRFIFDIETVESLDDSETLERWKLFSAYAKQQSKAFIVAVPQGSEEHGRQLAEDWGIKLDNVWVVK